MSVTFRRRLFGYAPAEVQKYFADLDNRQSAERHRLTRELAMAAHSTQELRAELTRWEHWQRDTQEKLTRDEFNIPSPDFLDEDTRATFLTLVQRRRDLEQGLKQREHTLESIRSLQAGVLLELEGLVRRLQSAAETALAPAIALSEADETV